MFKVNSSLGSCISVQQIESIVLGTGDVNDSPLPDKYIAFDFEWLIYDSEEKSLYSAAFVDNFGNSKVLHISDFNGSELDLLDAINEEATELKVRRFGSGTNTHYPVVLGLFVPNHLGHKA